MANQEQLQRWSCTPPEWRTNGLPPRRALTSMDRRMASARPTLESLVISRTAPVIVRVDRPRVR